MSWEEVKENYRKNLKHFLSLLEDKKLLRESITTPIYSNDNLKIINFHHSQVRKGITQLIERTDKITDEKLSIGEFTEFVILLRTYEFIMRIEYSKDLLVEMLDKNKFNSNIEEVSLGVVIKKINNKLYPLDEKTEKEKIALNQIRNINRDLFYVDFRNAIVHRKYKLDGTELFYNDYDGNQVYIDNSKFNEMNRLLIQLEVILGSKYNDLANRK